VYLINSNVADSSLGSNGCESRFMEIHRIVFGEPASAEKKRINDMRDALHIDLANQQDVDFFITDEKAILRAAPGLAANGIHTRICTAENCAAEPLSTEPSRSCSIAVGPERVNIVCKRNAC
jgi:hypothetical protein